MHLTLTLQTMIPQNKIFNCAQPHQNHVVKTIKAYLSARFFKAASQFQTRTFTHLPYMDYQLAKLPTAQGKNQSDHRPVRLMVSGFNRKVKVTAQLLRAVQHEYKVFCLAVDKFQQSQTRFFPLAIIFPQTALAQQWCSNNHFLSSVSVFDPFVTFESYYKDTFLVVRHDSVSISPTQATTIKEWNGAKVLANDSFKRKEYKLAIILYEWALGLLWAQGSLRDRAILHSNAAQSFFELSLSQNTLLYADTAIALDGTFVKSYYRKLCSLLELQQLENIPPLLMLMAKVCSKDEFTMAHQRYTRYMANKTGIYNWFDIIVKRSFAFGEYLSCKVRLNSQKQKKFVATSVIPKYELISVQKTAIYAEENCHQKKSDFMKDFFDDIYEMLQLEQRFSQKILNMLKEVGKKTTETEGDISHIHTTEAIFHSHCFKTLFVNQSNISICPEYTKFLVDEEFPNCTFLSLQGGRFYFAARDIHPNEILSLQLFNKTIESNHHSLQIFNSSAKHGLEAYQVQKPALMQKKMYFTCIRYLWRMFREPAVSRVKVIMEILDIMENFPQWEVVILVLCQLQTDHSFSNRDKCKEAVCRVFEKCFKMPSEYAMGIIESITYDL